MVARCFLSFVLSLFSFITLSHPLLGVHFFSQPSAVSIKKSWRNKCPLIRKNKILTKDKLLKRTIFTHKPVRAYQSALYDADNKKVSYIIYYYDPETFEATICTLYCIKEMRKNGCGSYLLLKCLEHLKRKKICKAVLQACPFEKITDEKALKKLIAFYTKFGFNVTHNQPIGVTMELLL